MPKNSKAISCKNVWKLYRKDMRNIFVNIVQIIKTDLQHNELNEGAIAPSFVKHFYAKKRNNYSNY